MSYKDSIDIGITADREQTPDVQTIVDGMRDDLAALVRFCEADLAGVRASS